MSDLGGVLGCNGDKDVSLWTSSPMQCMTWLMILGVWLRYRVITASASCRAANGVARPARAGNLRFQSQSNIHSVVLLSHKV